MSNGWTLLAVFGSMPLSVYIYWIICEYNEQEGRKRDKKNRFKTKENESGYVSYDESLRNDRKRMIV